MSSIPNEERAEESTRQDSVPPYNHDQAANTSDTSSEDGEKPVQLTKTTTEEVPQMSSLKMYSIVAMLFTTMFLIALDRLIIGVAVPSITNEFNSLADIGWYNSAYLLTFASLMLFYGRLYTIYHPKWIYITALFIFEVGSAVCGAAPNSKALIVGRAIAGIGGAGLLQGSLILLVYIVPLHKRPQVMGFGGIVFGLSSVLGPLLGGAFTDGPGWRWCFYINLPFGGLVAAMLVIFFHIPPSMINKKPSTLRENLIKLDLPGTLTFLPAIICLLLALQWGGTTYHWGNYRVVLCLVFAVVLFACFVVVQATSSDPTVPGRILFQRSIAAGLWFSFFNYGAMQVLVYYLPTWFQAVKGTSAVKAGIDTLPLVLGLVVTTMASGILTRRIGYFTHFMYICAVIAPIGAGMITTFTPTTNHSAWIGYQALYGLGVGFGMQQPSLAAQTTLPRKDVPSGVTLVKFAETLSGAIWIAVAENLFQKKLDRSLLSIQGLDPRVIGSSATEFRKFVQGSQLSQVLEAYNHALRNTFYLALGLVCVLIFGAVFMEWVSVKKDQKPKATNEEKV